MPPSWGCIIKSCVNSSHCQSLYPQLIMLYLQKLKVVKTQVVLATDECHNILKFGIRGKCLPLHFPSWTSYLQWVNCKFHSIMTIHGWCLQCLWVRVILDNSHAWSSGDMTILVYLLKAFIHRWFSVHTVQSQYPNVSCKSMLFVMNCLPKVIF